MLQVELNSTGCATVLDIRYGDILYLANRIDNPDQNQDKLSDGDTALMYVMAGQYLFLTLMALVFALIIAATKTKGLIYFFVVFLMPFLISM